MKPSIDNGFGYIEVEPVSIQKKGGLVLPETGGMRAMRIARASQGCYAGKLVMYRTHTEVRAEHQGKSMTFVPQDAIISLVELDANEEAVPLVEVSPDTGVDNEWIGTPRVR